jgi:hypothetical protein
MSTVEGEHTGAGLVIVSVGAPGSTKDMIVGLVPVHPEELIVTLNPL